jgi:hypothetical protein
MGKKTAPLKRRAPANAVSKTNPAVSANAEPSPNGQPINEEAVRLCAYGKWETAGKPDGESFRFWLEAEQELSHAE